MTNSIQTSHVKLPATSLTSSWVQTLKDSNISLSAQLVSAHERLAQLEAIVGHSGPDDKPMDADETAAVLFAAAAGRDQQYRQPGQSEGSGEAKGKVDFADLARTVLSLGHRSTTAGQPLPSVDILRTCLDAFFENHGKVYPVMQRTDMEREAALAHGTGRKHTITLLAIALGASTRLQDESTIRVIEERALQGLAIALSKEDTVSRGHQWT